MKKTLIILDPGHGDVVDGKNYSKDGKYSPKFTDGTKFLGRYDRFYEGSNNRDNVRRLGSHLELLGFEVVDVTLGSVEDVPLEKRVALANKLGAGRRSLYISVHSDAIGNGEKWESASGISVWTSVGQTKSDVFATMLIDELEQEYGNVAKFRKDEGDGDEDKESQFYVLRKTSMPAVLVELGFHTNEAEVKKMMTEGWKISWVNAATNAVLKWEGLAYE